jgi:Cu/Ag efflux protein CusF
MRKEQSMKANLKQFLVAACIALAPGVVSPVLAQGHPHTTLAQAKAGVKTMTEMVDGEVRRVDKAAGKVTLRHGDLKELEMPPMTMVFEVKDKAMLDAVKAGDKVKFKASDDNGKLTVIEMKSAK